MAIICIDEEQQHVNLTSDDEGNDKETPEKGYMRVFIRGVKEKHTLLEKEKLGDLCVEKKRKYDEMDKKGPRDSYIAASVREYYPDLANMKNSNPNFQKACRMATRCYQKKNDDDVAVDSSKKKFRASGGGRKVRVPDVREAMFEWFVDVRTSLKARLPRKFFKMKCEEVYKAWLSDQTEEMRADHKKDPMMFSNKWINDWMN